MQNKKFQDLTFTDDFMFCAALESNPDLCRQLVELFTGVKVRKVRFKKQYTIKPRSDKRGVRLDVYLDDEDNSVFDLEMQNQKHKKELPRRNRYYQGMIDFDNVGIGKTAYLELPDSYIVFICTFDPFDRGKAKYEFRELCVDDPTLELGDGTSKIFINALSKQSEMSGEMRAFLDYLCGGEPSTELTREIEDSINDVKSNQIWEKEYMEFMDFWDTVRIDERREGREEGREETCVENIDKLITKKSMSLEEACDTLDYSVEDYYAFKAKESAGISQ